MKQYNNKDNKCYNLGLNNIIINDINYYLYNKRHGIYYSFYFFFSKKYIYKGYYNMDIQYSHWLEGSNNYYYYL